MEGLLAQRYDYKRTGRLGRGPGDESEIVFLNRVIRLRGRPGEPVIEMEADIRYVELAMRQLGLETAHTVATPSVKLTAEELLSEEGSVALPGTEATLYRSTLMRLAYAAQDRPDIAETVKALARRMAHPEARDLVRLRRLARFLKGKPRAVLTFGPQRYRGKVPVVIEVDSDFAGDLLTRRSTGGVCAFIGGHLVRAASNLQSTISLSSGEAEYYACVAGAAAGIGLRAMLAELGLESAITIRTDSAAALGLSRRRGVGRVRHVATRYLWLQ